MNGGLENKQNMTAKRGGIYLSNITFYHYGIKGQKWGVRRFQNEDGSLKPAGRKRYSDDSESKKQNRSFFSRLDQKTSIKKKTSSSSSEKKEENKEEPKKKSVSEMTDQELRSAIDRKRLEQEYSRMFTKPPEPKKVSMGKKISDTLVHNVIVPASVNAGRNILQKYLEQNIGSALGIKSDSQQKKKDSK